MKKIIILIVGLVATVAVNAAACKWAVVGAKDHQGNTMSTGSIAAYAYVTADGIEKAFLLCSATPNESGQVTGDATQFEMGLDGAPLLEAGTKYSFYMVITDADGYTINTSNDKTLNIKSLTPAKDKLVSVNFGNLATLTGNADNWTAPPTEGVPEPTSAMLAMLGLAGLALRRKQK